MQWWAKISQLTIQGKLSLNWQGPYQVKEVIQLGMYYLTQLDGTPLIPEIWKTSKFTISNVSFFMP